MSDPGPGSGPVSGEHPWRGRATTWIAVGSAANGLGAFLFQIVGTRVLGADGYAPVGVLWTLQYLWLAVAVTAVEAYVARLVTVHGHDAARLARFLRLLRRWLVVAGVVSAVVGVAAAGPLFAGFWQLGLSLGLLVLGYGWYGVVRGRAAGMDRFRAYALATAGESLLRLVAAVVVLAVVASAAALGWVFPLGPIAVAGYAWVRSHPAARGVSTGGGASAEAGGGGGGASAEAGGDGGGPASRRGASAEAGRDGEGASAEAGGDGGGPASRRGASAEADGGGGDASAEAGGHLDPAVPAVELGEDGRRREATRFLIATSTANAAVQFLLAGGPLVLIVLGAGAGEISILFTTVTLARVPMTFALNGGLSRLLPPLTRMARADDAAGLRRATARIVAAIVAIAAVAAAGAALLGPEVVELLFGAEFRPGRTMITIVAAGTALAVGGLLLDQLYIATTRQGWLPAVWVTAVVLAGVLVAVLPGSATLRVAAGFALATAGGVLALTAGLLGPAARRPAPH